MNHFEILIPILMSCSYVIRILAVCVGIMHVSVCDSFSEFQ